MAKDSTTRSPGGKSRIRLMIGVGVTLSLLLIPVSALAATLTLSESTVEPGDTIEAAGSGYEDESMVKLCLDQEDCANLGQATTDDEGNFSTTVEIPGNVSVGSHQMSACHSSDDDDGELICSWASFTVESGTTTTTSSTTTTTTTTTTTAPTTTTTTAPGTTTTTVAGTTATTGPVTTTTTPPLQGPALAEPGTTTSAPDTTVTTQPTTTTTTPLVLTPTTTDPLAYLLPSPQDVSESFDFFSSTPGFEPPPTDEVLSSEVLSAGDDSTPPSYEEPDSPWLTLGGIVAAMTLLVIWVVRYIVDQWRP